MSKINVITIPENKENNETSKKILEMVEAKNKIIANDFNMEPLNLTVKLCETTSQISSRLGPNKEKLGIFSGYADGCDEILLINPHSVDGLFTNLWTEMGVITDYALVKLYLCKKYYPKISDFNLYHKYISDVLAKIVSGKFKEETIKFDFKMHFENKIYKKDKELSLCLYIMKKHSGIGFIFENLDLIMEDLDIRKTIFKIYKKNLNDLIKPEKEKILEEEKKLKKTFRPGRR